MIHDRPEQAAGEEEFAMNSYRCSQEGATEREIRDIPEEEHQLETTSVIYDQPVRAAKEEQFAIKRCRDGEDIPENGEQETAVEIADQPEQAAREEEIPMNDNISYSTVASDRRCREGATARENEHIPEEGERETAEVISDRSEQAAGGMSMFL